MARDNFRNARFENHIQPVWLVNRSGETIPPYACCRIIDWIRTDNEWYIEVGKPNAATEASQDYNGVVFNLHIPIGVNQRGRGSMSLPTQSILESLAAVKVGPKENSWELAEHTDGGGTVLENSHHVLSAENVSGQIYGLVQHTSGASTPPPARMQFKSTAAMNDGTVAVVVQRVWGETAVAADDAVDVVDPKNHRPGMVIGAVGWANWFAGKEAVTGSDPQPAVPARWELEHSTATISEMDAELVECLKVGDTSNVAVTFTKTQWDKSFGPNVDMPVPAEAADVGSGEFQILCQSPKFLHAIKSSPCHIRRVEISTHSNPDNEEIPNGASALVHWEIVSVEQPIAMVVKGDFDYTGSQFTPSGEVYINGFEPTGTCKPEFKFEPKPPCDIEGTFKATYYAELHEYHVDSTDSAMLGPPKKQKVLTDYGISSGCASTKTTVEAFMFCPTTPTAGTPEDLPFTTEAITFAYLKESTGGSGGGRTLSLCQKTISVIYCGAGSESVGACLPIITDGDCPDTTTPATCGTATIAYFGPDVGWWELEKCPDGCSHGIDLATHPPPAANDPQTQTVTCNGTPV